MDLPREGRRTDGCAPGPDQAEQLESGRQELWEECRRQSRRVLGQIISMSLFEVAATLFHMGQIDVYPARVNLPARGRFEERWAAVAPRVAATFRNYLAQRAVVRRPSTINGERQYLMEFAEYLAEHAPEVAALSDLKRRHIEAYKRFLATYPTHRARDTPVCQRTVYRKLVLLRTVFDRLPGRDRGHRRASGPAHPARRHADPGSAAAMVIDDGAAAKLLQAARADPDPFVRLAVEFLARTGLRLGEFMDLTTDAVVQIGSAYWLRVPIGKLHNDRYIPLHPQLKATLDEWLADRPPELRTNYVFMDHGRSISRAWVRKGPYRVAIAAGIGRVTPHQLRHTLATQAINRGMTLEALAALLGHYVGDQRSPASRHIMRDHAGDLRRMVKPLDDANGRTPAYQTQDPVDDAGLRQDRRP